LSDDYSPDTPADQPAAAIVESDTEPADAPKPALADTTIDPALPAGIEPDTIVQNHEGHFEKVLHAIEHDVETGAEIVVGWFKQRVNEDGSPYEAPVDSPPEPSTEENA
jgi:hypothetical protein